ncbi:hypothetical protein [Methanobacterium ferruginis]|uniref:hypothetical protein n=1 Tax=Methanobacterium ferruginis TaxID=710191 RepID=UPI00257275CF|nr:hypothetical protein [Methanobacterium ferruginis]BDZ66752.1 hypothetical protein GCM10025860_02000 [Methanobacterium ferruginis]
MSEDTNLRSKAYVERMGWGLFLGLISTIGTFIFILLMNQGQIMFPARSKPKKGQSMFPARSKPKNGH